MTHRAGRCLLAWTQTAGKTEHNCSFNRLASNVSTQTNKAYTGDCHSALNEQFGRGVFIPFLIFINPTLT